MTGCRRGEVLALKWSNVDLERGVASIVESAQRIKGEGGVLESPKSASDKRGIALDPDTVVALKTHRARQAESRLALGPVWQDHDLCSMPHRPAP